MESLWQIPHACTLIRTVPGLGSGILRSTISKGPFGRGICTARIVGIIFNWLFGRGRTLNPLDTGAQAKIETDSFTTAALVLS